MTSSTSCTRTVVKPVVMPDENVIFKCPQDTINGRVYVCDSTVYAMKRSALLQIYRERRECEAEVESLKHPK